MIGAADSIYFNFIEKSLSCFATNPLSMRCWIFLIIFYHWEIPRVKGDVFILLDVSNLTV